MVKELASYGQVMEPEQIAAETLTGVERGVFYISHGFDGFMLATLTSGASPVSSLFELLTQVTHCFVVASFHSVPHAGPTDGCVSYHRYWIQHYIQQNCTKRISLNLFDHN